VRVLILVPRLDVTFKEGPVPSERGPIPEIRSHWLEFIWRVTEEHHRRADKVTLVEKPLWQFKPEDYCDTSSWDRLYVPHRERATFRVSGPSVSKWARVSYYMQSVIPNRFYVDDEGWAGGVSTYPCTHLPDAGRRKGTRAGARKLRARAEMNLSKFGQPTAIEYPDSGYVFFPCQLPHDQTIKYHSQWSVERALTEVLESTKRVGAKLVAKGHPVNPQSQSQLREIVNKYDHATWVEDVSVHSLIRNSKLVACVNSGVGLEAILHDKPVVTFGRSDYDIVTMNVERCGIESLDSWVREPWTDLVDSYDAFLEGWCDWTFDVEDGNSFHKL